MRIGMGLERGTGEGCKAAMVDRRWARCRWRTPPVCRQTGGFYTAWQVSEHTQQPPRRAARSAN